MNEASEHVQQAAVATREKMRPIWYFVGWLLVVIGVVVMASGIHDWVRPPEHRVVLQELHTGIWWGAVITAFGALMQYANKDKLVD